LKEKCCFSIKQIKRKTYAITFELLSDNQQYFIFFSDRNLFPLTPVSRRVDGRRPVVKIFVESLSQHDEKHVVPNPLSGIRVGGRVIVI
jgi:hypothetical protein